MSTPTKTIAIFGGSFNPPQLGHAAVISAIASHLACDEIWVLPSSDRRDKQISVSGVDRVVMLELILKDLGQISRPVKIMDLELERPGLTSTMDTKEELEKLHPGYRFIFIAGSDVIPDIKTKWHRGEELMTSAEFAFLKRVGIPEVWAEDMLPKKSTIIELAEPLPEVSSTEVRNKIKNKESTEELLSPSVIEYIHKKGLYL